PVLPLHLLFAPLRLCVRNSPVPRLPPRRTPMRDPYLDKLADVLVRYSAKVKPGDLVCINSDVAALPLVEACYEAVLKAGAHPFWSATSESLTDIFYDVAEEK